jgi:asparagine synthase (glutamine-hydrolysing)
MADPTCIPLYFISKLARNYITVVLSGEGADETLGGYTLYRKILALEKIRQSAGPLASTFPAIARLPLGSRVRSYLRRAGTTIEDHYRGVVKGIPLETRLALSGIPRVRESNRSLDGIFRSYFHNIGESASPLSKMLYVDTKVWLPENLLLKADKMTMATAVELRVPFLDHRLVQYVTTLPDNMKVRDNLGKWILRQVMGTELPPAILHRKKKGFPMPAETWFRFELRDFVHDTLLARDSACREFFDSQAVEEIVALQEKGRYSGFQEVWSLLVFEYWHRQFIDNFVPAHAAGTTAVEADVFAKHGA